MNGPDTLRDRLADLAGTAAGDVPDGREVRRGAQRDRARRRAVAAVAGLAVVAAVALGGTLLPRTTSTAPATPSPSPTTSVETTGPAPSPTVTGATTAPPTTAATTGTTTAPPLTREAAAAVVGELRFPAEADWRPAPDTPVLDDADPVWTALACPGVAVAPDPLAVRHVEYLLVDVAEERQVVVFEDAASAAAAFADLRGRMRACHAAPAVEVVGDETWTTTIVGGQLELGEESFWVAEDTRITGGHRDGQQQTGTSADLLVLDDNVVVSILSPAWSDDGRAAFVAAASAEWEAFRPAYEAVRRS